ncbi:hypothetical protein THAOC_18229, partial [Thalassiosira oceanica]
VVGRPGLLALEDPLEPLEGHHDHVRLAQEDAQDAHAPLPDEAPYLRVVPAARRVEDDPASLGPDLLVRVGVVDYGSQGRHGPARQDRLDLRARPRGDVRQGPAGLLLYLPRRAADETPQAGHRAAVQYDLGEVHDGEVGTVREPPPVVVRAVGADDVAHRAERRLAHLGVRVEEELDESRDQSVPRAERRGKAPHPPRAVDHRRDVVRGTVAEVAQRPARRREDLVVVVVEHPP